MKMFRSDIFIIIPSFSIIRYTQISSSTFLLPQSAGIHRYLHHHFFFLNHQVYTDIFIIIPSSSIIRYAHHQQTSTHDSTHINTSIEMGIAFWTNEIFENERNFSWKIASFRKKLNDGRNEMNRVEKCKNDIFYWENDFSNQFLKRR